MKRMGRTGTPGTRARLLSPLSLGRPFVLVLAAGLLLGVGGPLPGPSPIGSVATRAHIVVAFQPGMAPPNAAWSAMVGQFGLRDPKPVFRGHPSWGIIDWSSPAILRPQTHRLPTEFA